MPEFVAILDFGSQYTQLIARRVREEHVYCEILRHDTRAAELARRGVKAVILSGGPASVYEDQAPRCDPALVHLDVPLLGRGGRFRGLDTFFARRHSPHASAASAVQA